MLFEILELFKEMLFTMGSSAVGTGGKIVSLFLKIIDVIRTGLPTASPVEIFLTVIFFGLIVMIVLNTVMGSIRTLFMIGVIVIGMLLFLSILTGGLF